MEPSVWKVEHVLSEISVTVLGDITEVQWLPTPGKWYYATISCRDKCEGTNMSQTADLHVAYHCTAVSNLHRIQQNRLKA
eukprot:5957094-Karenia_brevis.AAC.1